MTETAFSNHAPNRAMKQSAIYPALAILPLGLLAFAAWYDFSLFGQVQPFIAIEKAILTTDKDTAQAVIIGTTNAITCLLIYIHYLTRRPRKLELKGPIA